MQSLEYQGFTLSLPYFPDYLEEIQIISKPLLNNLLNDFEHSKENQMFEKKYKTRPELLSDAINISNKLVICCCSSIKGSVLGFVIIEKDNNFSLIPVRGLEYQPKVKSVSFIVNMTHDKSTGDLFQKFINSKLGMLEEEFLTGRSMVGFVNRFLNTTFSINKRIDYIDIKKHEVIVHLKDKNPVDKYILIGNPNPNKKLFKVSDQQAGEIAIKLTNYFVKKRALLVTRKGYNFIIFQVAPVISTSLSEIENIDCIKKVLNTSETNVILEEDIIKDYYLEVDNSAIYNFLLNSKSSDYSKNLAIIRGGLIKDEYLSIGYKRLSKNNISKLEDFIKSPSYKDLKSQLPEETISNRIYALKNFCDNNNLLVNVNSFSESIHAKRIEVKVKEPLLQRKSNLVPTLVYSGSSGLATVGVKEALKRAGFNCRYFSRSPTLNLQAIGQMKLSNDNWLPALQGSLSAEFKTLSSNVDNRNISLDFKGSSTWGKLNIHENVCKFERNTPISFSIEYPFYLRFSPLVKELSTNQSKVTAGINIVGAYSQYSAIEGGFLDKLEEEGPNLVEESSESSRDQREVNKNDFRVDHNLKILNFNKQYESYLSIPIIYTLDDFTLQSNYSIETKFTGGGAFTFNANYLTEDSYSNSNSSWNPLSRIKNWNIRKEGFSTGYSIKGFAGFRRNVQGINYESLSHGICGLSFGSDPLSLTDIDSSIVSKCHANEPRTFKEVSRYHYTEEANTSKIPPLGISFICNSIDTKADRGLGRIGPDKYFVEKPLSSSVFAHYSRKFSPEFLSPLVDSVSSCFSFLHLAPDINIDRLSNYNDLRIHNLFFLNCDVNLDFVKGLSKLLDTKILCPPFRVSFKVGLDKIGGDPSCNINMYYGAGVSISTSWNSWVTFFENSSGFLSNVIEWGESWLFEDDNDNNSDDSENNNSDNTSRLESKSFSQLKNNNNLKISTLKKQRNVFMPKSRGFSRERVGKNIVLMLPSPKP